MHDDELADDATRANVRKKRDKFINEMFDLSEGKFSDNVKGNIIELKRYPEAFRALERVL